MSYCSTCSTLSAVLAKTDTIIPHDILGGGLIAILSIAGMALYPAAWVLWLVILIIAVGITVDLSAHGWTH
jgi:hypothetical protein